MSDGGAMTSRTLRMLVGIGFALGLLLGAAVFVPRMDGNRSLVSQETPRFPSGTGVESGP